MVITRECLKTEIDNVQDDYLDALYRIIKVFEYPTNTNPTRHSTQDWLAFVRETYGCLADDPIERGEL